MPYRLFVDEVGNSDLRSSENPNHRYLSLTGVIVAMPTYFSAMDLKLKALKVKHFETDSIIFHRREMLDKKPPFGKLKDDALRDSFNADLLQLLQDMPYTAITIAIDKKRHNDRYGKWQFHPYHYCMTCLLERYVKFLHRNNDRGDVLAESRNRNEDEKLKDSYKRFWSKGSRFVTDRARLDRLSSQELKLSKKTANVNGLQIADLIASPSLRWMLCQSTKEPMTAQFGKQVAEILLGKYDTANTGTVQGYGCKWLP